MHQILKEQGKEAVSNLAMRSLAKLRKMQTGKGRKKKKNIKRGRAGKAHQSNVKRGRKRTSKQIGQGKKRRKSIKRRKGPKKGKRKTVKKQRFVDIFDN